MKTLTYNNSPELKALALTLIDELFETGNVCVNSLYDGKSQCPLGAIVQADKHAQKYYNCIKYKYGIPSSIYRKFYSFFDTKYLYERDNAIKFTKDFFNKLPIGIDLYKEINNKGNFDSLSGFEIIQWFEELEEKYYGHDQV